MFGYLRPDTPYLYMKDDTLYKSLYCGVCKSIGRKCGAVARFSLTYDIAFMSAFIHNALGRDVKITRSNCVAHPLIKRPIATPDDVSDELGCLNVILTYYKIKDDVTDSNKGRSLALLFSAAYKKAQKSYPALDGIVATNYAALRGLEKSGATGIDMVSDPFAIMLAQLSDELLGDKKTQNTHDFFYALGKWIYIIDALDDYDKDVKKGNYNPFFTTYGAENFSALKRINGDEVSFILSATLGELAENLSKVKFGFNGDLIRNIAIRGTAEKTKIILSKETGNKGKNKCLKNTTKY